MYLKKIVGTTFLVKSVPKKNSLETTFFGKIFLGNKIPWKQLSLETTFLGKKFLGNKIPWSAVPWNDIPWKKISLLCRITRIF